MMEEAEEITLEQEDTSVAPIAAVIEIGLLRRIIEGAILAANQPLTIPRLLELFDADSIPTKEAVQEALAIIQADCAGRGFELKEVASGWRFQVREDLAGWVNRLWDEKPQKYSRALLETLSLIAYRQPITRGDIEEIRGVAVSSHIMKTLMEREWVKVVGHRDVPGRPSLYATTRQFLDYFNLKRLEELPSLSEIRDLDEMNSALELNVDDEGLGEPDTDTTAAEIPEPVVTAEPEEFVDGEAAFEAVGAEVVVPDAAAPESDALESTEQTSHLESDEEQVSEEPGNQSH